MKIAYMSDVHTEIKGQRNIPLLEPVDVLVLAGDIGKGVQALQWAYDNYRVMAKHIIVVPGNHDHWGGRYDKTIRTMREYAETLHNVHFLENDTVEINGIFFIGATAWTDFTYGPHGQPLHMLKAKDGMKDYKKIKWKHPGGYGKIRPTNVLALNLESREYIFGELDKHGGENCVVVTHHAPCHLSIPERFADDELNCCYVNTWGNDVAYSDAKLWFHGHIHSKSDYMLGNTRVLCRPIGYPGDDLTSTPGYIEI